MIKIEEYVGTRDITDEDILEECKSDSNITVLNGDDLADSYDEMLDETYSFECVGGPFEHLNASRVLEAADQIGYRCGYSDYINMLLDDYTDFNEEYYVHDDDVCIALDNLIETYDKENA
jgi:hypothetical protein